MYRNGRGSVLNHIHGRKKSSTWMLVVITCSFLTISSLAVVYTISEKPRSPKAIDVVENQGEIINEITSSSNAIVYTGQMTGVITKIDTKDKKLSMFDIESGLEHEYRYSGGTHILDKYDKALSASQLIEGTIVDAYYIEDENKIAKLQISKEAWENIGVTGVLINEEKGIISYNGKRYPLLKNAIVLDQSKRISLADILKMDYVTLRGTKDNVCVISLTKGHGYLELAGEDEYIGGILYIGTEVITQIEKDMRIPIREGNYTVSVVNGKLTGSKEFTIERNKTALFDVSEFGEPVIQTGLVHFNITPRDAILYIDGVETAHQEAIELSYGEHNLEVSLGGYVTYNGIINVNSTDRVFHINLPDNTTGNVDNTSDNDSNNDSNIGIDDSNTNSNGNSQGNESEEVKDDNSDQETDEDTSLDGDDTEDENESNEDVEESEEEEEEEEITVGGVDESKTLTISCTEGTLVYVDGSYIGKIKNGTLVTKKYTGNHTIKLVLSGYGTKTYTIDLDDDGENAVLKFPAFY